MDPRTRKTSKNSHKPEKRCRQGIFWFGAVILFMELPDVTAFPFES
jgi:hypothetical protein